MARNGLENNGKCPVCYRSSLAIMENESICLGCGAITAIHNDSPMEGITDGEKWLVHDIDRSVYDLKLNRVITAVGPPGSGKSWTGIRMGTLLDESFNVDRIIFPGIEYVKAFADSSLRIGSFLLWDDAGLGAPAREFWSILNRCIGFIAQSSRFRRIILWITLPDKSFLDSQPRKLVDIHLEFLKRDKPGIPIAARIYMPETNRRTGKIYYKHPRIFDSVRGPRVLEMIRFPNMPDKRITDEYETRKHGYMMGFYKSLVDELESGGLNIDDHRAKMLTLLCRYSDERGQTRKHLASLIGMHEVSLSRAVNRSKKVLGITD